MKCSTILLSLSSSTIIHFSQATVYATFSKSLLIPTTDDDPVPYGPGNPCPCLDSSLCEPVSQSRFDKELFLFHVPGYGTFNEEWRQYNWDRITSIALWQYMDADAEFYCYAKSLGVRIFVQASPDAAAYAGSNQTAKDAWVANVVSDVTGYFADGINMDTEDAIAPMNRTSQLGLTQMAQSARDAFDSTPGLSDVLVTFDVGWAPNVDGRFYDYAGLAAVSDFFVMMDYDMASYIFGACLATPNSPPPQVLDGVLKWLSVENVTPEKLVLAVPWYGRSYECAAGTAPDARYCPLANPAPWRDCNCTDASTGVLPYGLTYNSEIPHVRDEILQNSYYNTVDENGTVTQNWFEDLESLSIKYAFVNIYDLKGVGIWTPNFADYGNQTDYTDDSLVPSETVEMWKAVSTIPFGGE